MKFCECGAKLGTRNRTGKCGPCYRRAWRAERPGYDRERWPRRAAANNARKRDRTSQRFARHGITREQYEAMLSAQGGRCATCRTDQPDSTGWHIDHDHRDGRVRGILCGCCNRALGQVKDNVTTLRAMIAYLEVL